MKTIEMEAFVFIIYYIGVFWWGWGTKIKMTNDFTWPDIMKWGGRGEKSRSVKGCGNMGAVGTRFLDK